VDERFGASGDNGFNPFRRGAERGRALRSIEGSDAPAGAGANVEDAPASADRFDSLIHRLRDLGHGSAYRRRNLGILRVDDPEDPFRRKEIDIDRARVAPFCGYLVSRNSAFW
jgi:hypothetical protein